MDSQYILAVVQSDLQFIWCVRSELEANHFRHLNVARNGQEAILYLRGVGVYGDRRRYPIPSLLILDCTNPDGADLEVLAWVREQPEFRYLPVILLCPEEHNGTYHVACALDDSCLLVNREDIADLIDAVRTVQSAELQNLASLH